MGAILARGRYIPADGGLYLKESDTAIQITWGVGEGGDWKDITVYSEGGTPVRVTEDGTNGILTVQDAGKYDVFVQVSAKSNNPTGIHVELAMDSGAGFTRDDKVATRRTIGAGSVFGSFSSAFPLMLVAGEQLKLQLVSDVQSKTIDIDHIQFTVKKIGDE